jgi:hypothetical protein
MEEHNHRIHSKPGNWFPVIYISRNMKLDHEIQGKKSMDTDMRTWTSQKKSKGSKSNSSLQSGSTEHEQNQVRVYRTRWRAAVPRRLLVGHRICERQQRTRRSSTKSFLWSMAMSLGWNRRTASSWSTRSCRLLGLWVWGWNGGTDPGCSQPLESWKAAGESVGIRGGAGWGEKWVSEGDRHVHFDVYRSVKMDFVQDETAKRCSTNLDTLYTIG